MSSANVRGGLDLQSSGRWGWGGDITILLTPGVFPMPHQRAAVDWMYFKERLLSTQSSPHHFQRIAAAFNHRLAESERDSWLYFVTHFPCMLVKCARSKFSSIPPTPEQGITSRSFAKQCIKYCHTTWKLMRSFSMRHSILTVAAPGGNRMVVLAPRLLPRAWCCYVLGVRIWAT